MIVRVVGIDETVDHHYKLSFQSNLFVTSTWSIKNLINVPFLHFFGN